ncbi:MAG TPA: hypothetical protein PLO51_02250, partial [Candidatus Micrarchaeota archaeon]|nr:hypothetical protein [Candidatus Micrarchaeota archaeon]
KNYFILFATVSIVALITMVLKIALGLDSSIIGVIARANPSLAGAGVFLAATIILGILQAVVTIYIEVKIIHYALRKAGLVSSDFKAGMVVRYFIASIVQFLHTLVFWRQKKHLLAYVPLLIAGILFIAAIAMKGTFGAIGAVLAMLFAVIAGIALFIGWMYHGIRLSMTVPYSLAKPEMNYGECSQESWKLTEKKVLRLFGYNLGMGLIIMAAMIPFFLVALVPSILLTFVSTAASNFASSVIMAVFSSLVVGFAAYFLVYIFKSLLEEAGAAPAQAQPAVAEVKPYVMPAQEEPETEQIMESAPAAAAKAKAKKPAPKAKAKPKKK